MQHRVSRSLGESSQSSSRLAGLRTAICPSEISHYCWRVVRICSTLLPLICCSLAMGRMSAEAADSNNVLLDFTAKWCGPCQQMSPIVSRLERQGFPIRKVDIDQEKELARQFNIDSIPCFVLVADGREVNRITGQTDEKELRRLLAMLPKQSSDSAQGKNSGGNGLSLTPTNPGANTPDERKSFPRIPPLFKGKQNPKPLEEADDQDATVRGQNPYDETTSDGFVRDPLAASIRIRVKDGSRVNFGSGTIIDSQRGRSVVLTCGHIFRKLGKDAVVEVDLFGNGGKPQTVVGKILQFDLDADVGLLTIPTQQRLPTIKLGSTRQPPVVKDRVFSIGCGGGDRPTREDLTLTAINKYDGPDNLECTGIPQQGRSGGGLFLGSEQIGVCIAADPKEKRGIYAGMKPVVQLLAKANLSHLVPSPVAAEGTLADSGLQPTGAALGSAVPLGNELPGKSNDDMAQFLEAATRGGGTGSGLTANSQDYLGAEVVCIVRPKGAGVMSRVVIVNQASSRFVDDLLHESSGEGSDSTTAQIQAPKPLKAKQLVPKPTIESARREMQQAIAQVRDANDASQPIETSFEPQRYRRKRD